MKRTPTSHHDVVLTVGAVKHDDLDDVDRHLLLALAIRSFGSEANRAYPGREALGQAIDRSVDVVRKRMLRLCDLGLVTLTHAGTGRGNANEYKINLEHPAYPESYKGISKKVKAAKGACEDKYVSAKGACSADETCLPEQRKVLVASAKGACLTQATSTTTAQPPPQPQHPPTKSELAVIGLLSSSFFESENQVAPLTAKHKAMAAEKLRLYGEAIVTGAFEFYKAKESFKGTKWPFAKFLDNFEGYMGGAYDLGRCRNEKYLALADELWQLRLNLSLFADDELVEDEEFLQTLNTEQHDTIKCVAGIKAKSEDAINKIDASLYWPFVAIRRLYREWLEVNRPEPAVTSDGDDEETQR
jgi:hypothetical protein